MCNSSYSQDAISDRFDSPVIYRPSCMKKIPKSVYDTLDTEIQKRYYYDKGGVLFMGRIAWEKAIDTLSLELSFYNDSVPVYTTKHSLKTEKVYYLRPYGVGRSCFKQDTTEGKSIYFFGSNGAEGGVIPIEGAFEHRIREINNPRKYVEQYNAEIHTVHYQVIQQQELKWLPMNKWSYKGKKRLDQEYMNNAYEDDEGNRYIVFEEGYYTIIMEVWCHPHQFYTVTAKQIRDALNEKGYYTPTLENTYLTKELKEAFKKFQSDHQLKGYHETMDALGF